MEQSSDNKVRIAVRNLVEFIFRSGDINQGVGFGRDVEAMQAGNKIHRKIQKRMGPDYVAGVPLSIEIEYDLFSIVIDGRADGIISKEDKVLVDEIKGVYADISTIKTPNDIHMAQAMC